jgi:hypothetical protein
MGFGHADSMIIPEIHSAQVLLYCKGRLINYNEIQTLCETYNALSGKIERPPIIVSVCEGDPGET